MQDNGYKQEYDNQIKLLVNKNESFESQVKEVLHQIVHNHPVFYFYTRGVGSVYFEGFIFCKRELLSLLFVLHPGTGIDDGEYFACLF